MPEEGMVEVGELKIHQASHARYFEDFLKFVEHAPEVELKLKADHISVKALLADFGDQIHIAIVKMVFRANL